MYQEALNEIKERAHINFLAYDRGNFHLINLIESDLKKAKLSVSFVANFIQRNLKDIIEYSIQKIAYYKQNSDKTHYEEYPEGEELDEDEKPITIKKLDYMPFILVSFGVEFFFIKEHPDKLLEYVRKLKMPGASIYTREITSIYNQVNNKQQPG